jgi:hypothetical protein
VPDRRPAWQQAQDGRQHRVGAARFDDRGGAAEDWGSRQRDHGRGAEGERPPHW